MQITSLSLNPLPFHDPSPIHHPSHRNDGAFLPPSPSLSCKFHKPLVSKGCLWLFSSTRLLQSFCRASGGLQELNTSRLSQGDGKTELWFQSCLGGEGRGAVVHLELQLVSPRVCKIKRLALVGIFFPNPLLSGLHKKLISSVNTTLLP